MLQQQPSLHDVHGAALRCWRLAVVPEVGREEAAMLATPIQACTLATPKA